MEISIWDPEHRKLDFKPTDTRIITKVLWRFIIRGVVGSQNLDPARPDPTGRLLTRPDDREVAGGLMTQHINFCYLLCNIFSHSLMIQ